MHSNEIKYLAPERVVSRMHEVTHQKNPARQVEIDSNRLITKEKAHSALQVKESLERRGIGLVFADAVASAEEIRSASCIAKAEGPGKKTPVQQGCKRKRKNKRWKQRTER